MDRPLDTKTFSDAEKQRQMAIAKNGFFGEAKFFGPWTVDNNKVIRLPFIFHPSNSSLNLYEGIRSEALEYFRKYNIEWWNESIDGYFPPGHVLSSQINCLNHLFALRKSPDAILAALNHITGRKFDEVMPSLIDEDGFLSFEFAYKNDTLLGEDDKGARRGTLCTSVDALAIVREGERRVLIPIEWKYTEPRYKWIDKTNEKRLHRYGHLIEDSGQLTIPAKGIPHSAYFHEPCYELMRQTLLMEQMIRMGLAEDFLHLNVIPNGNVDLRYQVEHNYVPRLKDKSKFIIADPRTLIEPIRNIDGFSTLVDYLSERYW